MGKIDRLRLGRHPQTGAYSVAALDHNGNVTSLMQDAKGFPFETMDPVEAGATIAAKAKELGVSWERRDRGLAQ